MTDGRRNSPHDNTNPWHLDPAVRDTIERLRAKGDKLTNGNADDVEAIGQAIGELLYLFAHFLESQPPTKAECEIAQRKQHEYVDEQIERLPGRGINWPTALTIITTAALISGTVVKIVVAG